MQTTEILVIGAGVIGNSIAYHLARQGRQVLVVAVGFSGHGFAIAPAIGRALADQLAGKPVPELDGLRPARTVSESVTNE